MMRVLLSLLVAITVLGIVACAQPVAAGEIRSDRPRLDPGPAATSDLKPLVGGNSTFAFDLYRQIRQGNENLFYSPHSISVAIAMTYAGARGETEKNMANALKFTLPQDRLHAAFNALDQELAKRGQGAKGKDGKGFRLNITNATWGQKGFSFLPAYLDVLAQQYGAGLRVLDFQNAPDPSRETINNWVSDRTEGRIKDLIPKGAIDALTRLVLTNAVYFNAAWQNPFEKEATSPGVFHLIDGKDVNLPMMRLTKSLAYAKVGNYEAVELPYDGRELSMIVLVPAAGQFKAFEDSLNAAVLDGAVTALKGSSVALTMPKFKVESGFSLKKALGALGMADAFTDRADLSGMDGKRDLSIMDVVHKSYVAVDEAGTEAAAATGVIVGTTSAPDQTVQLTVDRPFVFAIRDIKTGALIFVGRVMNPAA